jgi:conjugative transposon TraN protein
MKNIMKLTYIYFNLYILCGLCNLNAQDNAFKKRVIENQETLLVSDIQTTHLIFKDKIKYIDIGSSFFISDTIGAILKLKHTGQALDQLEISSKSNLTVITVDGKFYSFPIEYQRNLLHYSFHIKDNVDKLLSYRQKLETVLDQKNKINAICNRFINTRDQLRLKEKENGLIITILGIYFSDNYLAFKVALSNTSSIDYEIDNILVRTKLKKRVSPDFLYQEKIYEPVKICNNIEVLKGGNKNYTMILVFDKFTPKENEKLTFDVFEKNGGRFISINLPRRKLFNATVLD